MASNSGNRPEVHHSLQQFLKPCIDEWEVFNVEGTNVALKEHGTTVEASGSERLRDSSTRSYP